MEDDDVAAIENGRLTIHRVSRSIDDSTTREVITLKMEIQEIMKGLALFITLFILYHKSVCVYVCAVTYLG